MERTPEESRSSMIEINVLTNKSGVAFKKQQSQDFWRETFPWEKSTRFFKFTD